MPTKERISQTTYLVKFSADGKKFPRSQILFSSVAVMSPRANKACVEATLAVQLGTNISIKKLEISKQNN